jgi:hypothetical protein
VILCKPWCGTLIPNHNIAVSSSKDRIHSPYHQVQWQNCSYPHSTMFIRTPHMPNDLQNVGPTPESPQTVNVIASDKPSGYDSFTAEKPPSTDICPKSDTYPRPEDAKCSRCRETAKSILQSGRFTMFKYGLNLWYCSRCAALVGWAPICTPLSSKTQ